MSRLMESCRGWVVALVCALGCADEQQVLTSDPMATPARPLADAGARADTGGVGLDASARPQLDSAIAARSDAASAAPPPPAERCDGVDNDGNGTVDDVDVGRDGVCDCLLIATLGKAGGSGSGDVFGSWINARSDNGADDLADQTLTPELLAKYQVIVAQDLHDQRAYSPAEIDALVAWVHAGGGLLTLIGYAGVDERTQANAILARFGIDYGSKPILARSGVKTIPVTTWTAHPVTAGITAVGVDNGYPVEGGGGVLAQEGGYDLLRALEVDAGHVLAWGDEWITYDSEWKNNTDYQVELLWLNMIKWLTAARVCQVPPAPVL
jgi:hypothetical protein